MYDATTPLISLLSVRQPGIDRRVSAGPSPFGLQLPCKLQLHARRISERFEDGLIQRIEFEFEFESRIGAVTISLPPAHSHNAHSFVSGAAPP